MAEKAKGKVVYIRKINKETGKAEDTPYWVEGEDVYAIEKEDPKTGEWQAPKKEVSE